VFAEADDADKGQGSTAAASARARYDNLRVIDPKGNTEDE